MQWLRYYHETPTDPKWRAVAIEADAKVCAVLAVWDCMMVCASQSSERGLLEGWNPRVVGAMLDMKGSEVEAIYNAMQGLTLDGNRLLNWDKRQRSSDDVATRVKQHRDRKKSERNVTSSECNVTETGFPLRAQITDTEPSGITGSNEPSIPDADCAASDNEDEPDLFPGTSGDARETAEVIQIDPVKALFDHGVEILTGAGSSEKSARKIVGQLRSAKGDAEAASILTAAARSTDPVEYIQGAIRRRSGPPRDGYWRGAVYRNGMATTGAAI